MTDYSAVIKPVVIAIVIAVIFGIAVKALEKFIVKLFSKK